MSKLLPVFVAGLALGMVCGYSSEYHVSLTGRDGDPGTRSKPFRTISAAAAMAQPGDTITVHAGIYREEINPPRGGTSDAKRILYRAAPGETVEIRGSEVVSHWTEESPGIWKVEVPNSLFGSFNPFADEVKGDWFAPNGRKHHTGCVYIDGEWLFEAASKDKLPERKSWFAQPGELTTTIWAAFDGVNPNEHLTEINVRQTVFYPRQPFINYLTVRGFKMRQAAPNWAPPTAEQMGLIGTHWSKGWIIENNQISHSINVGISLGKYGDKYDNAGPTAEAYLDSIDRARNEMRWNKETIGSHVVRYNEISWCEQAGIVGSMGAAFSKVIGNHVHDIYTQRRFIGCEQAGIKFHAAIDVIIEGNRVHDALGGIWLDWMAQGTRVTRNLCYRNSDTDLFLEVDHGPFLIDNNLFLSRGAKHHSQGGAYAHNLFGGWVGACTDARHTPYFKAHSTEKVGDHEINVGDDRFYNNIFNGNHGSRMDPGWWEAMKANPSWSFGYGLWIYDKRPLAPQTGGNVYYDGATPFQSEQAVVVKTNPDIKVTEEGDAVYLEMTFDPEPARAQTPLVTSKLLGKAKVPDLPFETADGKPYVINADYFGKQRHRANPSAGPFEKPGIGRVRIKVWPLPLATTPTVKSRSDSGPSLLAPQTCFLDRRPE